MNPATPNYSYSWASGIFSDFQKKHVRATWIFGKIYPVTNENVVEWIAKYPIRWTSYKRAIKILEKWDKKNPFDTHDGQETLHKRVALYQDFLKSRVFRVQ